MTSRNERVAKSSLTMNWTDEVRSEFISYHKECDTLSDMTSYIHEKLGRLVVPEVIFYSPGHNTYLEEVNRPYYLTRAILVEGNKTALAERYSVAFKRGLPIAYLEYSIAPAENVTHICRDRDDLSKILLEVVRTGEGEREFRFYKYETRCDDLGEGFEYNNKPFEGITGIPMNPGFSFFRGFLKNGPGVFLNLDYLTTEFLSICNGFHTVDPASIRNEILENGEAFDLSASIRNKKDSKGNPLLEYFRPEIFTLTYLSNEDVKSTLVSRKDGIKYSTIESHYGIQSYFNTDGDCTLETKESNLSTPYNEEHMESMITNLTFMNSFYKDPAGERNVLTVIPKNSELYKYFKERTSESVFKNLPREGVYLLGSLVYFGSREYPYGIRPWVAKHTHKTSLPNKEDDVRIVTDVSMFKYDLKAIDYTALDKAGIVRGTSILKDTYGINVFKYMELRDDKCSYPKRVGLMKAYTVFLLPEEAIAILNGLESLPEVFFLNNRMLEGRPVIIWHNENPMNEDRGFDCRFNTNDKWEMQAVQSYSLGYFSANRIEITNTVRNPWILEDLFTSCKS